MANDEGQQPDRQPPPAPSQPATNWELPPPGAGNKPGPWSPAPRSGGPRQGRGRLMAIVVAGVVLLAVSLAGLWMLMGWDWPLASSDPAGPAPTVGAGSDDTSLDEVDETAVSDLFEVIDEAELAMLDFMNDVNRPPDVDPVVPTEVAGEAVTKLEGLKVELNDVMGSSDHPAVQAVGSAYFSHLEDWIDWAGAVADDSAILGDSEESAPYSEAIGRSAAGFVAAVEESFPDRDVLPDDLSDLIDRILERGFSSEDDVVGDI